MPRKKKTEDLPPDAVDVTSAAEVDAADLTESARPDDAPSDAVPVRQIVTFTLESQLYGLPIEVVQEIQQLVESTPVPDTASALIGLIDLRGMVVPAIDLRVLVGLPARSFTLDTPMIFCRVREHVVCLVVDDVEDVVDLPEDCIQPPSGLYNLADRMLGMCRLPQGLVLLLDIERLVPEAALAAADAFGGER